LVNLRVSCIVVRRRPVIHNDDFKIITSLAQH
jgi:hypothetical protein